LRTFLFCHYHELCRPASRRIGLTEVNYGYIVTAFSLAYALGLLVVGRFIDRAGTKIGYAVAVAVGPWAENWYPPPLANQEI
jgi:MFS family permease